MPKLDKLPASPEPGVFHVVVESPRGSSVKLKYEPRLEAFSVSRPLPLGMKYPFDWGFIPSTRGPDGDPIDALVYWDTASFPGTVLHCSLAGVIELEQDGEDGRERNDRVIAVPEASLREELSDVTELPERTIAELCQFFLAVVALDGKKPRILGVKGPEAARKLVTGSRRRRAA